jgi:RHH-type rel operon transcriptional repressor/antitoxin RelB
MPLKTITFRLPEEKLRELDSFAEVQRRDRSFVINEAVTQYLSLNDYHRTLIEEGLQQDDAGETIDHDKLMKTAASWVRKPRAL